MANERITEDIVRSHFKEDPLFKSIKWEEQRSSSKRVQELLKGQSKGKGKGSGYPEFILSFPTNNSYIIVIECKATISDHESITRNNAVKFAVDGVLHYSKALAAEFNVIGIAVSGQNETELKVSHFYWKKGAAMYSELEDKKLLQLDDYLQVFDDQFFMSDFYTRDIAYKAQFLNEEFNNYTIPEYKRCTMISAMLLALISDRFQLGYGKEATTKKLGQALLSAINSVFDAEEDMVRNKTVLMREFESILNEPIFTQSSIKNKNTKKDENTLTVLKEIITYLLKYVYPLISHSNIGYDVLGRFYIEFIRYAASEQKSGLVLTPSHITELFCDLGDLSINDIVYDPCCGTGGFLVAAMQKMFKLAGNNKKLREKIRKYQLCGCELRPDIFSYACSSMRFRGDGKSNIYNGSCFNHERSIAENHKPTVSFLNPPYDVGTAGQMEFIEHSLSTLDPKANGRVVAIVQMSCATKNESDLLEVKKRLLSKHHLKAVISMPDDLFYPVGVVTCIMVFEANKPNAGRKTWFGYFKDDGYEKRKHIGRIDVAHKYNGLKETLLSAYRNLDEIPGLSVRKEITAKEEWCAEAYMETDYSVLSETLFDKKNRDYCAYKIVSQLPIGDCDLQPILSNTLPLDSSKWKYFRFDEIFDIKKGFYNKKPDHIPNGNIPFIGATDTNNGVTSLCTKDIIETTSKTGDDNNAPLEQKIFKANSLTVSNNGSIGYAFYQPVPYTCTHDVNPLYLKGSDLNPYIALFLCTIIELDRYRWTYGRKWRPARMPSSLIKLPVNKKGEPNWLFMENFLKSRPYSKLLEIPSDLELSEDRFIFDNTPFKQIESKENASVTESYGYNVEILDAEILIAAESFEIYQWNDVDERHLGKFKNKGYVLLGCYRDKTHLEWILSNHLYNVRLGKRKGSMESKYECFNKAKTLYLYNVKHPDKLKIFNISGIKEMSGAELKTLGYPHKSPSSGKRYMTFTIEEISGTDENPTKDIDIRDILNQLPNHKSGAPVFIQPEK